MNITDIESETMITESTTEPTVSNETKPSVETKTAEVNESVSDNPEIITSEPSVSSTSDEKMFMSSDTSKAETTEEFSEEEFGDEDLNFNLDQIDNILDLDESSYPRFTLAKNKARFLRMVNWYRAKEEWIDVAPLSGVSKLFKQQSKELEGIRSNKLDYEMELETGTLTPSQRSYKKDELKMCKVQEKMAVHLITKLQKKIKSGRR